MPPRPTVGIMVSKETSADHATVQAGFVHVCSRPGERIVFTYSYVQDGASWRGTFEGETKPGVSPPVYKGEWTDNGTDEWRGSALLTLLVVPDSKHFVLTGLWEGHPKGKGNSASGSWLLEVMES
jgi:hypothetical protein